MQGRSATDRRFTSALYGAARHWRRCAIYTARRQPVLAAPDAGRACSRHWLPIRRSARRAVKSTSDPDGPGRPMASRDPAIEEAPARGLADQQAVPVDSAEKEMNICAVEQVASHVQVVLAEIRRIEMHSVYDEEEEEFWTRKAIKKMLTGMTSAVQVQHDSHGGQEFDANKAVRKAHRALLADGVSGVTGNAEFEKALPTLTSDMLAFSGRGVGDPAAKTAFVFDPERALGWGSLHACVLYLLKRRTGQRTKMIELQQKHFDAQPQSSTEARDAARTRTRESFRGWKLTRSEPPQGMRAAYPFGIAMESNDTYSGTAGQVDIFAETRALRHEDEASGSTTSTWSNECDGKFFKKMKLCQRIEELARVVDCIGACTVAKVVSGDDHDLLTTLRTDVSEAASLVDKEILPYFWGDDKTLQGSGFSRLLSSYHAQAELEGLALTFSTILNHGLHDGLEKLLAVHPPPFPFQVLEQSEKRQSGIGDNAVEELCYELRKFCSRRCALTLSFGGDDFATIDEVLETADTERRKAHADSQLIDRVFAKRKEEAAEKHTALQDARLRFIFLHKLRANELEGTSCNNLEDFTSFWTHGLF
jgi:hypothetical protein